MMYEFLAPWGVLVPAISAVAIYVIISEFRREKMLTMIEATDDVLVPDSYDKLPSGLA